MCFDWKIKSSSVDQQGQYSRWNCSLIYGVEVNSNEDTDKLTLNIMNDYLKIDLKEVAVDCAHCIGDQKKKRKNTRSIIAKFVSYYDRQEGKKENI